VATAGVQYPTDIEALERFILDNPELKQLEARIAGFNIFEAVGVAKQELRHSDFLSFLLYPSANHGLKDAFLKEFLVQISRSAAEPPMSPLEIDLRNFASASVAREWNSIDILIEDSQNGIRCFIENKISSTEHSGQLKRYHSLVKRTYPKDTLIPVFLTPDGAEPSDERYIPFGYTDIIDCVEKILHSGGFINPDSKTLMEHYVEMLRRYIVTNSDIADLCRRIYRQHQRALDLIFEHRPDLQQGIYDLLVKTIQEDRALELDSSSKGYIRFLPKSWDAVNDLRQGSGWTATGRILLFEFSNRDALRLRLYIGPGPGAVRQKLFDVACDQLRQYLGSSPALYSKWNTIWLKDFLSKSDYDGLELEDLTAKFGQEWEDFLAKDLPALEALFSGKEPPQMSS
jgi:hypothetical protein